MKKTHIILLALSAALCFFSCSNKGGSTLPLLPADDAIPPTFSSVPLSGSTLNGLNELTITFSEPILRADDISGYNLDGPGLGTMSLTSITEENNYTYTLNLDGDPGNGALFISLLDVTDSAGNPLSGNTVFFMIDSENPIVLSDPGSGTRISTLGHIDLTYSKPVDGADDINSYILSGAGIGTLAISGVAGTGGNTYRLTLSGTPGDGPIVISIHDVADMLGSPLSGNTLSFTGDSTPPSCTSQPSGSDRISELTEVFISFSEPVTGAADVSNYAVSGSGAGSLGIASAEHYMNNTYRVALSGSMVEGDIQVQLSNIQDLPGHPLSNATISFTGDLTNPTQSPSPAEGTHFSALDHIDIIYSKPVLNATAINNYLLSGSGAVTLSVSSVALLTGTTYRLTLAGTVANGPITVTINDVTDLAGNPLMDNRVNYAGDIQSPAYTSDPADTSYINDLSTVVVTFSEPVLYASDKDNYSLSGSGSGDLNILSITPLSDVMYQVNLTGTPVDGQLSLQMQNISDYAGNAPGDDTIQYTVDTVNPTFTSTPSGGSIIRQLQVLDISFSTPVVGANDLSSYSLGGTGKGGLSINNAVHVSGNSYRLYFSGEPTSGGVTVTMSGITDEAGNGPPSPSINLTVDIDPPTQTSVEESGSIVSQLQQVDIIFSEAVTGASTLANYILTGTGKGSLTPSSVSLLTGTTYRLRFTGTPVSGQGVTITMYGIADTAGNHIQDNTITYSIDSVNPTKIANPASGSSIITLSTVTITYSEQVQNADTVGNYILGGAGTGTLSITGVTYLSGNAYQLSLSGSPLDGEITITISNVIDAAGNQLNGNIITYYGDSTPPTVSASYPSDGATSMGTDSIIQIIFSENVDPATIISSNITVHDGTNYLSGSLTCWGRHVFFTPFSHTLPSGATITVRATTGVTDLVAYNLAAEHQFSFTTSGSSSVNMIPDTSPVAYSTPEKLTAAGNYIFFSGYLSGYGDEPCAYNTVAGSTALVKDIYYDPIWPSSGCDIDYLTEMNETLYFSALSYSDYGRELWKSNGTSGGTTRVTDIAAGTTSSSPQDLTVMGNTLYFTAHNMSSHLNLYKTDGTPSGTTMIISISSGSVIKGRSDLTPGNSVLYFERIGSSGCELYKTDGTTSGTFLVKDINPGILDSYPARLSFFNDKLYFSANDGAHGGELWQSDGTDLGTVLIRDINPTGNSFPEQITGVGSTVFFIANDGVHGKELWKTDGTEVGTVLIKDITAGSTDSTLSNLVACNGYLYFINDADGTLWRSDGTETGTVIVKNFDAEKIIVAGSTLYLAATTPAFSKEIWKSDGTEEGTFMLTDSESMGSGALYELIEYSGKLYFTAWKTGIGTKIWLYQ